jgi:predicted porin
MQKKIIALAVVAAAFSAPAFADTTVYGIVDAAVANISADNLKSDLTVVSGGLSSSRLGVKVVEDLADGMKAVAVIEFGLDAQNSAASNTTTSGVGAARQQMLALAGSFGTVATGYLQTTGYDFGGKFDPAAGSTVSPLGNVTKGGGFLIGSVAAAARSPRALAYISPDMGGVVVAVNYATSFGDTSGNYGNLGSASGATAGLKTTAYLMSANYTAGPLVVGGVYVSAKSQNAGALGTSEYSLGGSYDLGMAKLFGTYQSQKTDNAIGSNKAVSMSAVAPVGPGALVVSYAKNTIDSTVGADNANGLTLGYLYSLSKTTTAYGAYTKMSQDSGTKAYTVANNVLKNAGANGFGSSMVAVGLKKAF